MPTALFSLINRWAVTSNRAGRSSRPATWRSEASGLGDGDPCSVESRDHINQCGELVNPMVRLAVSSGADDYFRTAPYATAPSRCGPSSLKG
jgi:hypothetical protein